MRQILSLSLPAGDVKEMKHLAHKRGYESVSAYIKYLLKADEDLISEAELLKTVQSARHEYRLGKSVKAHSIADLL